MPRFLHYTVHPLNPQPRLLGHAASVVRAGGVALLPTAAGYLPACRLDDKAATARLARLAGTPERDPPVLLCRDLSQAAVYLRIDDDDFRAIRAGRPGDLAHTLPCTRRVPRRLAAAARGLARLYFAGHTATEALLAQFDEALLLAPAAWGPGPESVDELPPRWQAGIDLAVDAGPLPEPARDAFAPAATDAPIAPDLPAEPGPSASLGRQIACDSP
ncbi:Sua5/YciO/YrdC/YwlC family protein [Roseateles sp.]|uniref:Sua5/YciO/YrdC/YwlC family protein n=1 Tax=Roseateles sp. TaxID=1971397 RepID=UPI002E0CD598|nr:Sua5/YciO/YrdC/YwlC family protein [Roseateles sp.]HEV6965192.1 Sua5/YciO/YrdC/YwlC family protein [Roseateles sp.]